jgi:hypothetical protein
MPEQLPAEERERLLWQASVQYMRGHITVEQFEETERRYEPNLKEAVLELARQRLPWNPFSPRR